MRIPFRETIAWQFRAIRRRADGSAASNAQRQWLPPLFTDSVIYGIGNVASRFVGLILVPLYTRVFAPAEYALLDVLMVSSVILYILAELQIVSGVARGYSEAREDGTLPVLLGTATSLYFCLAMLWSAVAATLYEILRPLLPAGIGWIQLAPIVLLLFPQQVFSLLQLVLRYEGRPAAYVGFAIADVVTSGIGSVVAIFLFHSGIAGVLWALVVSKALWASVLFYRMRGVVGWGFNRGYATELLAYGMPTVPSVLTKWGQNYANRYVLAIQLSLALLGPFSLAVQISGIVAVVDSAFRQAWDPRAMQRFAGTGNETFFVLTLNLYLAGMFLTCSGIALFAIPLVGLLAGPRFASASPVVGFLVFGQMWNGAAHIMGSGNAWARRTYWNAAGFGSGALLNVLALVALAPRLGILAGGVTYLAGATIAAWIVLITAQRSHYIAYAMPMMVLATIGAAAVAYGTYYWSRGSVAHAFPPSRIAYSVAVWFGLAIVLASVTATQRTGFKIPPWSRSSSS